MKLSELELLLKQIRTLEVEDIEDFRKTVEEVRHQMKAEIEDDFWEDEDINH